MKEENKLWTNPSVVEAYGDVDPVENVRQAARQVVVEALDAGWTGPPFDPRELARIRRLGLRPRGDIRDARLVVEHGERPIIEYNPNRPPARIRYSIAHEVAHTLFPDYGHETRHRKKHQELEGDNWELEALCNIAAAELLMPLGSFKSPQRDDLTIDRLISQREMYGVSTEALLIRSTDLTPERCAMFAASATSAGGSGQRFRIDYSMGSRSWESTIRRGTLAPAVSVISQCKAIQHTAKGDEKWPGRKRPFHVECVGIPPYPGSNIPRVVGFLSYTDDEIGDLRAINFVVGDASSPRPDGHRIIAHVVNNRARTWGGRGFAQAIRAKWELCHDEYAAWATSRAIQLGDVHFARVETDITVASMVAQAGYGDSKGTWTTRPRIRYTALATCLEEVARQAKRLRASVHMPRIGTGQAGGSWDVVEELISDKLIGPSIPVTVYDLPGTSPPRESARQPELLFD